MSEEKKSVSTVIKWYKPDKGYGFVRYADGSGEAFLHSRVVAPLGDVVLTEGTIVVCDVADTPKGPQVAAIHAITPAPPAPPAEAASPAPRTRRPRSTEPSSARTTEPSGVRTETSRRVTPPITEVAYGTVRWYNLTSQSGLIDPWENDTGVGVYFDRSVLRESGLDVVADGEDVRFVAIPGDDGPVALKVELA